MANTFTKLEIKPNLTYFVGAYVQDMKAPVPMKNNETGEVTEIQLNRLIVQLVQPVDRERWQCNGAFGSAIIEKSIPLNDICYVFGKEPKDFDLQTEIMSLIGCPVRLDFSLNSKGKAILRGITPIV